MKDTLDEHYWDRVELLGAYLRGEKTLDEVMDVIELMLAWDMWATMLGKIDASGGHGPTSPYDQPLVAKTNYSAQIKYELEAPVRRAEEVKKAHDKVGKTAKRHGR